MEPNLALRGGFTVERPQTDEARMLMASYGEREKELLAENAELRQALLRLQRGMQELVEEGGSNPVELTTPVHNDQVCRP